MTHAVEESRFTTTIGHGTSKHETVLQVSLNLCRAIVGSGSSCYTRLRNLYFLTLYNLERPDIELYCSTTTSQAQHQPKAEVTLPCFTEPGCHLQPRGTRPSQLQTLVHLQDPAFGRLLLVVVLCISIPSNLRQVRANDSQWLPREHRNAIRCCGSKTVHVPEQRGDKNATEE